jgi:protein-disulfide isomerase
METRFFRQLSAWALVAALSGGAVLLRHRTQRPFSPEAPGFRQRGPAAAKVTIVEFSDFQCPACRTAELPLRQLLALYDGRVRFVFKHYPLRMHEWAKAGAYAAECAGRQGRFWEFHDRLYDKQDDWTAANADDVLTGYARDLKLDLDAWQACRRDPSTEAAVASDVKDGGDAWVTATPTFFVDGRRFVGAQQLRERTPPFIDEELKK